MNIVIEILRSAGETTRLRILALLAQGELTAGELSSVLGQSQPRVSRHLKLLAEANIIERRPEGAWVFVRLANIEPACHIVKTILAAIDKSDFVLKRDLERLQEIRALREAAAKTYFETISGEWESLRALHQPEVLVEKAMLEMVKGKKFDFHLDLGSGFGTLLEAFAKQTKCAEGVDSSRGMLGVARSRLDNRKDRHISVRQGDILDLPYNRECADFVTIHQVLHYLDNPEAAIKEAARVLADDGTLLIADFDPHNHEELREKYGHRRLGFAIDEVKGWIEESGLVMIDVVTIAPAGNLGGLKVNIYCATKPKTSKNIKIDNLESNRNFA